MENSLTAKSALDFPTQVLHTLYHGNQNQSQVNQIREDDRSQGCKALW